MNRGTVAVFHSTNRTARKETWEEGADKNNKSKNKNNKSKNKNKELGEEKPGGKED